MKEDELQKVREENETLRRDLQRRIQASDGESALQKQVSPVHTLSSLSDAIEEGKLSGIFFSTNSIQSDFWRYIGVFSVCILDGDIFEGLRTCQHAMKLSWWLKQ